jgi:hypothetical protein
MVVSLLIHHRPIKLKPLNLFKNKGLGALIMKKPVMVSIGPAAEPVLLGTESGADKTKAVYGPIGAKAC